MLRNSLILIPFNAKLEDGCDYALQTIRILSRANVVVAVLLGEPYAWSTLLQDVLQGRGVRILTKSGARSWYFRPLMILPGQRWLPIKKVNMWLSAWLLKWWLNSLIPISFSTWIPSRRIVWFFEPFFMPAFLHVFSSYESVYDCVDRYSPLGREAQQAEAAVKRAVDHMTVISEPLLKEHRLDRSDLVKVPLGFDEDTFTTALKKHHFKNESLVGKPSLCIGFCGGINYRFDFPLLFSLITTHPQHTFWFIGPLQLTLIPGDTATADQVTKLLRLPNVQWTPPVPKKQIPQLISQMDVCLIPYDLTYEFNHYCHPMKVAEYLFLGKPIITTAIPELTQPLYRHLLLIGTTAKEFGRHVRTLQHTGWPVSLQRRQRQVARRQSWEKKVEAVSRVLVAV